MRSSAYALCFAAVVSSGCATTVIKAYPGPVRPDAELARVGSDRNHIKLNLDGDGRIPNEIKDHEEYFIAPGHHKVAASYYEAHWRDTRNDGTTVTETLFVNRAEGGSLEFDAVAGHHYVVSYASCDQHRKWFMLDETGTKQHIAAQKAAKKTFAFDGKQITPAEVGVYCIASCSPDPSCAEFLPAYEKAVADGTMP